MFDYCMHLRFPLRDDLLESALYLGLASFPSFELVRESSPQAQSRNQGLQRRSVKILGKTQHNVFSPSKAFLLNH